MRTIDDRRGVALRTNCRQKEVERRERKTQRKSENPKKRDQEAEKL